MSDTPTHEEWVGQARQLFGADIYGWRFVCPSCGDVYDGREFSDTWHETNPGPTDRLWTDDFGRICMGRMLGALSKTVPKGKYTGRGCDWCAFGLFRGPVVVSLAGDATVGVFRFAPKEEINA